MSGIAMQVYDCPSCGAPLPAARIAEEVTCSFCRLATTIEDGGAAMRREQASRAEAEALFPKLGSGPTWSQRAAVVLVNKWLWIFGSPFLVGLVVRVAAVPRLLLANAWERAYQERLLHVAPPHVATLLSVGWAAALLVVLLVWSLLGERIEARRDLQAALAAVPPKTKGGSSSCRNCTARLDVLAGAFGVRCPACGADNLVRIPASWASRATKIEQGLRLSTKGAREREVEGRRRVRRAAMFRVPWVVIILAVVAVPTYRARTKAGFTYLRQSDANIVGVHNIVVRKPNAEPTTSLRIMVRCEATRAMQLSTKETTVRTTDSAMCNGRSCEAVALMPLAHGESVRLRLLEDSPPLEGRLLLAPRDYTLGLGVLYDGFGEPIGASILDRKASTFTATAPVSGFYKVRVIGPPGGAVEVCILGGERE